MLTHDQAAEIFKALADPNRLQLFELLLCSDRTNSELMEETGLRQNLLSHHLTILADSGLIRVHRSAGDARRHYYSVNLATAGKFQRWWARCNAPPLAALPDLKQPRRVLFLCLRNTSRSMIAEALARQFAPHALVAHSAGVEPEPAPLPAVTRRVLEEHGVAVDGLSAQTFHDLRGLPFDYLITVCDIVHESQVPAELQKVQHLHWSLRDPIANIKNPDHQLRIARELYDEIEQRLALFVQCLAQDESRIRRP